jgi:predicted solute-binding protein
MNLNQIAYSPCPNDTFIFYHLVHGRLKDKISEELHDVEVLNERASRGIYPFTKLSFAGYFFCADRYVLLRSGGALGRGVGPILVQKKGQPKDWVGGSTVLIPGLRTTANLLLSLYTKNNYNPIPLRYDQILPSVLAGEARYGIVIHEERFTYEKLGLEKVKDLGEFWEEETGMPIPLGAIAGLRSLEKETLMDFEKKIQKSIQTAYEFPIDAKSYIKDNSQNKEDSIIQSHIDTYVNEFSIQMGLEGMRAVQELYKRAISSGFLKGAVIIPESDLLLS